MTVNNPLLLTFFLCFFCQFLAWLWQIKVNNADIVDITWSLLLVISPTIYLFHANGDNFHFFALLLAPIAWYLRLSLHLISRYQAQHEDGRYKALRRHWDTSSKYKLQAKFLLLFLAQGLLAWIFSIPAYIVANLQQEFSLYDVAAIMIIILSFIGVTVSDIQLTHFRKKHKGSVCNIGLWRYSRHPNYFFEWLHWLSYPLLGLSIQSILTLEWLTLVTIPFLMLLFLLKFTGIPYNEQQNLRSKGNAYKRYQQETNTFFPGRRKTIEDLS